MKSHTAVALDGGQRTPPRRELTVGGDAAGCEELLAWARGLGAERLIASRTAATSPAASSATCCPAASVVRACHPS